MRKTSRNRKFLWFIGIFGTYEDLLLKRFETMFWSVPFFGQQCRTFLPCGHLRHLYSTFLFLFRFFWCMLSYQLRHYARYGIRFPQSSCLYNLVFVAQNRNAFIPACKTPLWHEFAAFWEKRPVRKMKDGILSEPANNGTLVCVLLRKRKNELNIHGIGVSKN